MATERVWSSGIDAVVDSALSEQRLVGAVVLVANDGSLIYQRAAGFADRETQQPVEMNTIFRYASLTKPIVSAAAMAMVEQGQIQLDDPVTRWLPDFRPKTADGNTPVITVRHLLTHTAGLDYGSQQPADNSPYRKAGISDGFDDVPPEGLSIDEELRRISTQPLLFAPGTSWNYSVAMDVTGEILAKAAGRSLPEVVDNLITRPLGMHDTGFRVVDESRLATPYADDRPPRRMLDPDTIPFGNGALRFSPSRIFRDDAFYSGGGGMAGTATDFLAFLEAVRTGGDCILRQETTLLMMSNQIGDLRTNVELTPAWGFGIGGSVLLDPAMAGTPQSAGTWKWGGVYGNHWFVDPARNLTVVALTNTAVEGLGGVFASQLLQAIYRNGES